MQASLRSTTPRPLLILLAALVLSFPLAGLARAQGTPSVVGRCGEDLAGRLALPVEQVRVVRVHEGVFPDASLGLPRPDEVYSLVQTPGYAILLQAGRESYLYTATDGGFRYGGPLDAGSYSALSLQAVPNEPNLNGNLVQTSLAGTNPRVALEGVSDFQPQANGSILAVRRTSRSGHDLLHLAPGGSKARRLAASFAFVSPTLDGSGERWASFARPQVGGPWLLVRSDLDADLDKARSLELPPKARPVGLYWTEPNPVAEVILDGRTHWFEQVAHEGPAAWREFPHYQPAALAALQLNKNEHLEVRAAPGGGATQVVRAWFTGDETVLATIPGFEVKEFSISPEQGYLVLSGRSGDQSRAFAVHLHTGEVLPLPSGFEGETRLLRAASEGWSRVVDRVRP